MICSRIIKKVRKILGVPQKQIFADRSSTFEIAKSTHIQNSRIVLKGNSRLLLDEGVVLRDVLMEIEDSEVVIGRQTEMVAVNCFCKKQTLVHITSNVHMASYDLMLNHGLLEIGDYCEFYQGRNGLRPYIQILEGEVHISDHNVVKADFWVRFGGKIKVGVYNCINERTELRADNQIVIGNYNMISYECNIWDTNTHCMYEVEKRRDITRNMYPVIGGEFECPKTKPVFIGSDCWIGKRAVLLKGTIIEDKAIVGVGTLVSNQTIHEGKKAVNPKACEVE